jgi:hypothetical protein
MPTVAIRMLGTRAEMKRLEKTVKVEAGVGIEPEKHYQRRHSLPCIVREKLLPPTLPPSRGYGSGQRWTTTENTGYVHSR